MKPRKSKLDAFAERISAWQADHVKLEEMQTRLQAEGCAVSVGRLGSFCASLRQQELRARVLGNVASGARMNREIESAFAKNPEPKIGTLVSFIKRLVLELQIEGSVNPDLLSAADGLFKSLLDYMKVEQRAAEIALNREKFEHLKLLAEKAGETEKALDNAELTPEQRAQRIQEIYGRA